MYEAFVPQRGLPAYRQSQWKKRLDDLARTMFERGYVAGTLRLYFPEWVDFVSDYEDDGASLPAGTDSPAVTAYLRKRCGKSVPLRKVVSRALLFLLGPGASVPRRCGPRRRNPPLPPLYLSVVPDYLEFASEHRGRRNVVYLGSVLRKFCVWLAARRVDRFSRVSARHTRDYLASLCHLKRTTLSGRASVLRCFFRYLAMRGLVSTRLVIAVEAPRIYRMSDPPQILDERIVDRLLAAVTRTTDMGRRDFAMLLLAARYGMRPCDILGLRLDDVHWRARRIVLMQSKTQRPLALPLVDDVEAALVDYLRHGRPACTTRAIFVRNCAPITALGKRANLTTGALRRAFKAAGITPPEKRFGLYLLRHTAATRMLAQGAPMDTISDVLGHADVKTTRVYSQVDLAGLRSVALSEAEV